MRGVMSSARPSAPPQDSPEVAALRKRIRGEPLTDEELGLLARSTRKPVEGVTFTQAQVTALLAARARVEE
jgi:hypothetical protein